MALSFVQNPNSRGKNPVLVHRKLHLAVPLPTLQNRLSSFLSSPSRPRPRLSLRYSIPDTHTTAKHQSTPPLFVLLYFSNGKRVLDYRRAHARLSQEDTYDAHHRQAYRSVSRASLLNKQVMRHAPACTSVMIHLAHSISAHFAGDFGCRKNLLVPRR